MGFHSYYAFSVHLFYNALGKKMRRRWSQENRSTDVKVQKGKQYLFRHLALGILRRGREGENCSKCWRCPFDWLSNWSTQGTRGKVTGKGISGMIPPLVTQGQQIPKRKGKQMKVGRLVREHMWDNLGDCDKSLGDCGEVQALQMELCNGEEYRLSSGCSDPKTLRSSKWPLGR